MTAKPAESATPLTDAAYAGPKGMRNNRLDALCRQLERELSTARADAERYRAITADVVSVRMPRILPPFLQDPSGLTCYKNKEAVDEAIRRAGEGKS